MEAGGMGLPINSGPHNKDDHILEVCKGLGNAHMYISGRYPG